MKYKRKYMDLCAVLCALVLTVAVTAIPGVTDAESAVNVDRKGVAIKGYDSVAYHTENRAVKGSSEFSHEWNDARWLFASAGNRDLFAANPERYAPQYGGY